MTSAHNTAINEPVEDILMNMDRATVESIISRAMEEHLGSIIDSAVRRVTDELDNLSGEIESVISDAISSGTRAGEDVDPDDVESLNEQIVNDVMAELADVNLSMQPAEKTPTIAERYAAGQITLHEAVHLALGQDKLHAAQIEYLLKFFAEQHEEQFAVFLWRRSRGGTV